MSVTNRKPKSTIGEVRGRLTILEFVENIKGERRRCQVRCVCGTEKVVVLRDFRNGNTRSCGCLRIEKSSAVGGLSSHPLYYTWKAMVARCTDENRPDYHNYGGRGITVCERWRKSLAKFLEDMGPRPDGYQMDRVNNDGGYEPGNCRWATPSENSSNRRNTVLLTANGKTQCQRAWADELNVRPSSIADWIKKGKDFQWVYNHLRYNKKQPVLLTANGRAETLAEWARIIGVSRKAISYRLRKGQDFQDIHDLLIKRSVVNA